MSVAVQHPKKNKNLFIHIHLFDSNFSMKVTERVPSNTHISVKVI